MSRLFINIDAQDAQDYFWKRLAFREVARQIPPPRHREDTPRERGRPARILSLCLALSFPAMRQQATLPAGTPWARPKQRQGAARH